MKKKVSMVLIIVILAVISVNGSSQKQDINDMAYVVAIGIDVRRK